MTEVDKARDDLLEQMAANQGWLLDKWAMSESISAPLRAKLSAFKKARKAEEERDVNYFVCPKCDKERSYMPSYAHRHCTKCKVMWPAG